MIELEHDYDKRINIQLAATEASILNAAAQIYAARIIAGSVTEGKENSMIRRCIKESVQMASTIDEMIKAEGEM